MRLITCSNFSQVTGSAGGIGRQICTQLAGTGAVLVCWDIDVTNNDKFVKELVTRTGVVAYSFQTDISNRIEVKSLLHRVRLQNIWNTIIYECSLKYVFNYR